MNKTLVSLAVAATLVGCSGEDSSAKIKKLVDKCPKGSTMTIQLAINQLTGETAAISCAFLTGDKQ